jgi:hypothetical protein
LYSISFRSNSISLSSKSTTGRQFNIANKRRQGDKVETHSDLVSGLEAGDLEDAVIAVALSRAWDRDFVEREQRGEVNVFRAKKDVHNLLWKMQDTSVPTSPTWALPRDIHVDL